MNESVEMSLDDLSRIISSIRGLDAATAALSHAHPADTMRYWEGIAKAKEKELRDLEGRLGLNLPLRLTPQGGHAVTRKETTQ